MKVLSESTKAALKNMLISNGTIHESKGECFFLGGHSNNEGRGSTTDFFAFWKPASNAFEGKKNCLEAASEALKYTFCIIS